MKPISTLRKPLPSVDLRDGIAWPMRRWSAATSARCPAAAVVGEAMVALVLADAFLDKFGGDSVSEVRRNFEGYVAYLSDRGWELEGPRSPAPTLVGSGAASSSWASWAPASPPSAALLARALSAGASSTSTTHVERGRGPYGPEDIFRERGRGVLPGHAKKRVAGHELLPAGSSRPGQRAAAGPRLRDGCGLFPRAR